MTRPPAVDRRFTEFGLLAAEAARAFTDGMNRLAEAAHRVGTGLKGLSRDQRSLGASASRHAPLGHVFMPNLDLVCTVPRCGRGPEGH